MARLYIEAERRVVETARPGDVECVCHGLLVTQLAQLCFRCQRAYLAWLAKRDAPKRRKKGGRR